MPISNVCIDAAPDANPNPDPNPQSDPKVNPNPSPAHNICRFPRYSLHFYRAASDAV